MRYIGPEVELLAVDGVEVEGYDDIHFERTRRYSTDNGRTWSTPERIADTITTYQGHIFTECEGLEFYDTVTGLLIRPWLRQVAVKGVYNNFTSIQTSADQGRIWSAPTPLCYEPPVAFNPDQPLSPAYLDVNQGYFGNSLIRHSNGTLLHVVAHANTPSDPENHLRAWRTGSVCFIGQWKESDQDYTWTPGGRVEISPALSSRGLMEPEVAELRDGRVLIVWRGSNTSETPGRKFFSLSDDGGRRLSTPREWRYSDGTSFYSPSSYHRIIQHSVTGSLYWFGNICDTPPVGNSPRYPLVMAEIDEETASLKRDTLTVLDDRKPNQGVDLQLSNFSVFENRETHQIEGYLSCYGEFPGKSMYTANCYRYVLTLYRSSVTNH